MNNIKEFVEGARTDPKNRQSLAGFVLVLVSSAGWCWLPRPRPAHAAAARAAGRCPAAVLVAPRSNTAHTHQPCPSRAAQVPIWWMFGLYGPCGLGTVVTMIAAVHFMKRSNQRMAADEVAATKAQGPKEE
jgi:hypothetical protein